MEKTDSQPKAARSKTASSAKNVGRNISDDLQPDDLLSILKDHLLKLSASGIDVRFLSSEIDGKPTTAFFLVGVQPVDGELLFLPEKQKAEVPES